MANPRDVTAELDELCGLLDDGEMVKTAAFDLSKAIS
jgi:hypothetical protein